MRLTRAFCDRHENEKATTTDSSSPGGICSLYAASTCLLNKARLLKGLKFSRDEECKARSVRRGDWGETARVTAGLSFDYE